MKLISIMLIFFVSLKPLVFYKFTFPIWTYDHASRNCTSANFVIGSVNKVFIAVRVCNVNLLNEPVTKFLFSLLKKYI